ncbi:MAG: hypothetical protein K0R38_1914 [Polyangiaceae bacterium]|jgi:hypothetical protein|nr:hypothetical protein [Polyangiaceae bacterium]
MALRGSLRGVRSALALACGLASWLTLGSARAAEGPPKERQLTPEEIDAWLDSRAMPKSRGESRAPADDAAAPPPPPRRSGFVLESSIGVMGQLGHLKNITPTAPWFGLRFGYEPLRWLMVFAESDLFVASTSYAKRPPPPRSFVFWNVGAGVRLTIKPTDRIGVYVQGSVGAGRATEDVLELYGYQHAEELGLYQSGELGVEWYQVNPHLALALHGGIRHYPRALKRDRDQQAPLTWLSGLALRYTF